MIKCPYSICALVLIKRALFYYGTIKMTKWIMSNPGLFFHRFLLNSRQFKLKDFSKLKNDSLNLSKFHILSEKFGNFREFRCKIADFYYITAKIYI